ncbi:type III PLP-dependent enzyme [Sneathiella sp. P13V-1]|uniref:type III PLP-dependent enzyme n=1 Tax=Sneathiella sp. P13V-1 TaxID=2697366 RepID=UPI00187B8CA1|nr:type III PLP-dependent enzyme [Sneathiella sp. P13V-1]MBE7636647.1 type III PLP-dependent enzyme [Sneathiella sp. P13V-1]
MQIALQKKALTLGEYETSSLGLRAYNDEATALSLENCADAVHFLYPEILTGNLAKFTTSFAGTTLYAIKANPHPSLLTFMWKHGIRSFEAASIREIRFILSLLPDAEIYYMHPVKSRQSIREAYQLGVRAFAFDCAEELYKIETGTDHAEDLSLFLRLHMDQADARYPLNDKFGLSLNEAPLILQRMQSSANKLGVTFHVGSQCMNPDAYRHALSQVRMVVDQAGVDIHAIDVGGGFPVSYPGMDNIDLAPYFDTIKQAIAEFDFGDVDLLCEPGRALSGNAGAVAVRVELKKSSNLYLNDGTYGALFDAGISNWKYPLSVVTSDGRTLDPSESDYKFYGPTCDSLDMMAGPYKLPADIEEGDWIIFHHLGAYGYAMQTKFNGFYSDTVVEISAL